MMKTKPIDQRMCRSCNLSLPWVPVPFREQVHFRHHIDKNSYRHTGSKTFRAMVEEDGTHGNQKQASHGAILEYRPPLSLRIPRNVTNGILQVYNENIRDLLNDTGDFLDLREDPIKVRSWSRCPPVRLNGRVWFSLPGGGSTNIAGCICVYCCILGQHHLNSTTRLSRGGIP